LCCDSTAGYTGDPRGTLKIEVPVFRAAVHRWASQGFQVNTHCIGDRCNRVCLDAYNLSLRAAGSDGAAERHRIEHAQILSPSDLPRFAPLHVIAAMQPTHATSDSSWVVDHIGAQRARGSYAWRDLLDSGARLALVSCPGVLSWNRPIYIG
jgi:predicted amidohydrolase YtcJ